MMERYNLDAKLMIVINIMFALCFLLFQVGGGSI